MVVSAYRSSRARRCCAPFVSRHAMGSEHFESCSLLRLSASTTIPGRHVAEGRVASSAEDD
jgi:hypothetical protein